MNNVQRTDPNYEAVYLQYIYMCVCMYYGCTYTCVYSIYVKTAGGTDADAHRGRGKSENKERLTNRL